MGKRRLWALGALLLAIAAVAIAVAVAISRFPDGLSVLVCIALAAFSFLLDFDSIDKAIKEGAPANTSWYFAFGLMVTLVWLYLEILRLLSYMRN